MNRFEGRNILITGGSSGIGKATAGQVAAEGGRVILVARDVERLEAARAALPGQGHRAVSCDVTCDEAVGELMAEVKEEFGVLHGLAHCAGMHWLRPLKMLKTPKLMEMLTSHVASSVLLVRELLGRRLVGPDGGSVVWVSSTAALRGEAATTAYAAAKGALVSAGRALAVELSSQKVRINVVAPGVVETPQSEAFLRRLASEQVEAIRRDHLFGFGRPRDVARPIAFLLSEDARWITGQTLVVDGGLTIH